MKKLKKLIISNLLLLVCSLFLGASVAFAGTHYPGGSTTGNWYSRFMRDGNGYSEVWTTNGSGRARWYFFDVQRAGGRSLGYSQPYIANKGIYTQGVWGQPFLDRRGGVNSYGTKHYPGFTS
ncbi:hypothetical protein [Candidatus Enterococcus mansonii]|uniref:Lactococcin 972 family bacteriocin n=1 Tax=Candidatus Enterococcus mansonii TaxID=1834181 RepID=A0A242CG92_9ENTE|nr:hypothetical protein [Enterococcus sp. 4G2_DIV0659]OTO08802.1 hypothetical protein A5880_001802 [Enterococcus sp. 4G2_DIV0659]